MPQVPSYDNFQTTPNSTPNANFQAQSIPDIAGSQAQQFGQGLSNAGNALSNIATDMQQQANQVRVDDGLNELKEITLGLEHGDGNGVGGFTNLKGKDALQHPDSKSLADTYGDVLQEHISRISDGLGNDAQRQMFQHYSNDILTQFKDQAQQHASQEYRTYSLSVSDGIQQTAMRDIALNYNNPDVLDSATDRIKAEVYRKAGLLGYSAEWQEAEVRKVSSSGYRSAIMSALQNNDPMYASGLLNQRKSQMEADDIIFVNGHITNEVNNHIGMSVANETMRSYQASTQPSNVDRAFNIMLNTESGSQQFNANGSPTTSAKGAIGIAQVMPATAPEAAKLAGLPWDENRYKNDPEYNKALGKAYFQKQVQDFGALDLAMAAYNAGPGATQKALKQAEDAERLGGSKNPLDYLPAETRNYVTKNTAAYTAGMGVPAKPSFLEIDNKLRADPRLAGNPVAYKIARDNAQQLFKETNDAIKQQQDNAVVTAMQGVMTNGGRYSDLPVNVRAAVPADQVEKVMNFGKRIAYGDNTTNLALYQKLSTDKNYLKNLSDDEFFKLHTELSDGDFKYFSNDRAKLKDPSTAKPNDPNDLNSTLIDKNLNRRLNLIGVKTTKLMSGDETASNGALRLFVDSYIRSLQHESGKKFEDGDINKALDDLFSKSIFVQGWSGGNKPLMSATIDDIDDDTLDQINRGFKEKKIDNPTNAQILNQYLLMQVAKR